MSGEQNHKEPEESPICYSVYDDVGDSWNYYDDVDSRELIYTYTW